jgi:biopolymer transport protein ExbB
MIRIVLRFWPATVLAMSASAALADDAPPAGLGTVASAVLPHDLSPWSMFLTADPIVKAVILGLAVASVVTWTVWVAKAIELFLVRRRMRRSVAILGAVGSLAEAAESQGLRQPAAGFVAAALAETAQELAASPDGIKERIASRLERLEAAAGRAMSRGTGVLATIGATAPFVGLFGTVWGIMNSFVGISKAQTTNLAVVAPGIAEALLATAMGLVAAIPAVVIYNLFARQTAGCRALVGDAAAAVLRLVSRELDRGSRPAKLRAAE